MLEYRVTVKWKHQCGDCQGHDAVEIFQREDDIWNYLDDMGYKYPSGRGDNLPEHYTIENREVIYTEWQKL